MQLIKSVDTLSAHLERMFASHAIDRMVLMFGSSCANPKEIYVSVYVVRLFQGTGGSLLSTLLTIVFRQIVEFGGRSKSASSPPLFSEARHRAYPK